MGGRPRPVLETDHLSVALRAGREMVPVLRDITVTVNEGEIVGIVGETGSGKSLLIHSLVGGAPQGAKLTGTVLFEGRPVIGRSREELRPLLGTGMAIIASHARLRLNPLVSIGRQIEEVLRAHSQSSRAERHARVVQVLGDLGFADAARQANALPHELSGGMVQRVLIAMALVNKPRLLLADEPTFGLDVTVQRQVLEVLRAALQSAGTSSLLVTRDLGIIAQFCDRVAVMYAGEIQEIADRDQFFRTAKHPYSHELLRASFVERGSAFADKRRIVNAFDFGHPIPGCVYEARCPFAVEICHTSAPELVAPTDNLGQVVRCHRRNEALPLSGRRVEEKVSDTDVDANGEAP